MIISKTPLRISFMGGGSDFESFYRSHNGAVLTTAIDKYVYVIVKERFDHKIVLNYTDREIVDSVKDIKHELIREAMLMTGVAQGIEITTLSDIPAQGTGLGSSSSITVGLLHALYAYQSELVTKERLANEACEIEIEHLNKPIGRQDQYIASYGNLCLIRFNHKIEVTPIYCQNNAKQRLEDSLLLFYTGITRSADSVLVDQESHIEDNVNVLKEMAGLALLGKTSLEKGETSEIGYLIEQNWGLKKLLSDKISNPEIDKMYKLAKDAGAIGGKITGAGAGGFMLLFVENSNKDSVRKALKDYRELPFRFDNDGTKIIFDGRK
jgi:D-glycero-alpha-D-manno-heptose-7-phosphate kinase